MKHLPHASGSQLPEYAESGTYSSKEHSASSPAFRHGKDAKYAQAEPSSNDPPPAYSASADVDIPDDALVLLSKYDTVFLVDDSLSMIQVDKSGFLHRGHPKSRWELVRPNPFQVFFHP
jgi:hypothetical protein